MSSYHLALVGRIAEVRTRHSVGLPGGPQRLMPPAEILVAEVEARGSALLVRFTGEGEFCGDTWHESLDEAKEQAAWEYEGALSIWVEAPPRCADADDALEYAQRLLRSGRAGRD